MSRINSVENPIINSPYEEPRFHWYIKKDLAPEKRAGRRPASYFLRVPERAARGRVPRDQKEMFDETAIGEEYSLERPNLLRKRLAEWRFRSYEGATKVTKELL